MNHYWSGGVYCKQGMKRLWGRDAKLYERVILAIMRCSRDKYIDGKTVDRLARVFASRTVPHIVCRYVFEDEDMFGTNVAGMLSGERPFALGSSVYREFLERLKKKATKKTLPIELHILNLQLKEMKNGN